MGAVFCNGTTINKNEVQHWELGWSLNNLTLNLSKVNEQYSVLRVNYFLHSAMKCFFYILSFFSCMLTFTRWSSWSFWLDLFHLYCACEGDMISFANDDSSGSPGQ